MAAIDRDLLASHVRNKMADDQLSLRQAAHRIGCSPATLSRVLEGSGNRYEPDTATLEAIVKWLRLTLGDFVAARRPATATLADVEMYLHALPDISDDDARALVKVVRAFYDEKRTTTPED